MHSAVLPIHNDIRTRLQFGQNPESKIGIEGPRASAGADSGVESMAIQCIYRCEEMLHTLSDRATAVLRCCDVLPMAAVSLHSLKGDPWRSINCLCDLQRLLRRGSTGAVQTDVDINKYCDVSRQVDRGSGKRSDTIEMIDNNRYLSARISQLTCPRCRRGTDNGRGDQNIVNPGAEQCLGFSHLGHAHSDSTGLKLKMCQIPRLMRLRMRADRDPSRPTNFGGALQIVTQRRQLDHRSRGRYRLA